MVAIGAMIRRDVPPAQVVQHAIDVAAGFDELWVVEDLTYAGGISQVAAVLEATKPHGTMVGHGIAPAPFRNPAALAMEWATLASMYPGRFEAGIGHGLQTWMTQIGEAVESPLTLLRETIEATKSLLAGDTVDVHGRYVQIADVTLKFPPEQPPRILAGVTGPNSLRLSGEVADGTLLSEGLSPEQINDARHHVDAGRQAAGRTEPHRLTVFVGIYCGDLSLLGTAPPDLPQDGWDIVGPTPEAVLPDIRRVIDTGIDSLVFVPFGDYPGRQLQYLSEHVVPTLR